MQVTVLFFGALIEVTNVPSLNIDGIDTTDQALEYLHQKFPLLCHYKFSVALNQDFLSDSANLHDGDEMALLPPFAGG